ncbi:MAG: MBL fold metallo-hydrolase, partial [Chitinophagaceae bacterium]
MNQYTDSQNGFSIIPLSEGSFTVDKSKLFVPFNTEEHELNSRPIGSLLVEVQPFVIVTPGDIILIDAGLGFKQQQTLQLHANLLKQGITADKVTKVLMSHLHKDHAGGISYRNNVGHYQLSFPNATYYVQKQEYDNAMEIGYPSYMTEELAALEVSKQVVWLNGNGIIDDFIQYELTGAHSRFHQVYWLKIGNKTLFFGGDDAPQLQQMKSRFIAKYDYNGKKCMELRQQ